MEDDLYDSIVNEEIGGAVLDVFWSEPVEIGNRWLKLKNVISTPHIAGASLDVVENHCSTILLGIDKWLTSTQKESE